MLAKKNVFRSFYVCVNVYLCYLHVPKFKIKTKKHGVKLSSTSKHQTIDKAVFRHVVLLCQSNSFERTHDNNISVSIRHTKVSLTLKNSFRIPVNSAVVEPGRSSGGSPVAFLSGGATHRLFFQRKCQTLVAFFECKVNVSKNLSKLCSIKVRQNFV
jgi:hypothetical protein